MAVPYVSPQMIINAPTGISWESIPELTSSSTAQYAEQLNICWRATHWINGYCNQVLRATVNTEELLGPTFRLTVDAGQTTTARFIVSRWPVTSIVKARWSATGGVPNRWNTIPLTTMFIEDPNFLSEGISTTGGAGAQAIRIAPGYVSWFAGRNAYRVQLTYVNGWSHCGVVTSVDAGATQLEVTDCTGMLVWNATNELEGITTWLFDGANTELVEVTTVSASTGPGTVTLKAGTTFPHTASLLRPLLLSSLPEAVQEAGILHATYQALVRGATATTVQAMPGTETGASGAHSSTLLEDVKTILDPYRRVI